MTPNTSVTSATWEPPGPGSWICDRSHASPGPTPLYRRIVSEHTAPTYRRVFERFGGAIGTIDMQFVNGAMYRRLVPVLGADRDRGKVPPNAVLWLVSRLHPELRRRERTATGVLADRIFLADVRSWVDSERHHWIERNRELQAIDPVGLDDPALAAHLRLLDQRLVEGWQRHHELHASDLGPIGDLLAHTTQWGLDPTEVMALLEGSSPATVDVVKAGRRIAEALHRGGVDPSGITAVEQIRSVPQAGAALDDYLDVFGWRLISDYDIEGLTLHELPGAVCGIVRRAASSEVAAGASAGPDRAVAEALRSRCPDPALFDELLDSARQGYGVRDDNGPLTWAWPAGLMRRAYLEAAGRLAGRGQIETAAHAFELDVEELAAVLEGAAEPPASDLAARAERRAWEATLEAPDVLGPVPAEPDLRALPPGIGRLMAVILAAVTLLEPDPGRPDVALAGLGIGSQRLVGTARVADDPIRAVQEMAPGDVLVAPWTAPSFNAVLSIAGGVVVQEGGLLCHAAVMARELGIPAVVGCAGAMTEIRSGDRVELDPANGTVRVLERAGS
jgi:pyruvate,water dikinase